MYLKFSRILRSLVTTCARSIIVDDVERMPFDRFMYEGLKILKHRDSDYPNEPGVRCFKLLEISHLLESDDFPIDLDIKDTVNIHDEYFDAFKTLSSSAAHQWFSVPGNVLRYDFTNLNETLETFMVGAALSLLPWRDDNSCHLTMHGKQLDPGNYYIRMVDMFIFERELPSQDGPFRCLSEEVIYSIIIEDGYIHATRRKKGRKSVNLKRNQDKAISSTIEIKNGNGSKFDRKGKKRDKGIGIG